MNKLPKASAAKMASDLWHLADRIEVARKKKEEDLRKQEYANQAPARTEAFLTRLGVQIRTEAEKGKRLYETSIENEHLDLDMLRAELIAAGYRVEIGDRNVLRPIAGADGIEFQRCCELLLTVEW